MTTIVDRIAVAIPKDRVKYPDKLRALELLAKIHGLLKDAPPPAQFHLDLATLGKLSDEDLERALKHAEFVHRFRIKLGLPVDGYVARPA